ncbi:prepilin-type N-terminal cleavage/methylation domain-containing protein [Pseudomonas sp. UL073]|uniref:Prepilin-type N-terminal cleavage/methylation domain-containing protein n=1 Tax=Zestomonas insulae TaxID=2809017 RepID=A0ABS2IJ63_9GAMM|nr:prepilin-type N-terminal cleavage/methylation domain-containing protein [Pseudomonas insulae]MBM7063102.1 prepilin-type N-terminal cleavage/methylation domain-containing protein [Pseudomonas insulae]
MLTPKYQSGLSLIEMMIALVISSFLIIGVTQIYIDNKRSYAFQQSQAENQEGSRFVQLFLQDELTKAGYRRRPDEPFESAFPADTTQGCGFNAGETIKRLSGSSICLRYQPRDGTDRNCEGNTVGSAASVQNPYTKPSANIVEKIELDTTKGEITCNGSSLVSGAADLRFEFGVGSAVAPQTIAKYIKVAPASTEPILTVRYTVLMRASGKSQRDAVTVDTALQNWTNLTGATTAEVAALKAADSGQLYQVSQGTVMLRNRMP